MVFYSQRDNRGGNHNHLNIHNTGNFMKRIFLLALMSLPAYVTFAQIDSSLFRSWSISVSANEYGFDTGLGVDLSSPAFLNGAFCFRLKASTVWMEAYTAVYDRHATYQLIEVMSVYQFSHVDRARAYLEAGIIEVFPSGKFSDVMSVQGFGARVGAELFAYSSRKLNVACFFGGGINRIKAVAEKIESRPSYADGFVFTTGLRFYVPGPRSND
jgi:hypothetical protein